VTSPRSSTRARSGGSGTDPTHGPGRRGNTPRTAASTGVGTTDGNYRTLYTGQTLLGCLLEVLACFRPDPILADDLDQIIEDPDDRVVYPTPAPGIVPRTWLIPRAAATGTLIGLFCAVTTTVTLSTLRPLFLGQALRLGLPDFDAAALRLARPRALTQAVSSLL